MAKQVRLDDEVHKNIKRIAVDKETTVERLVNKILKRSIVRILNISTDSPDKS